MRAIRVSLVAALAFSGLVGPAHAGLFDCLKGQTITIPPIQFSQPASQPVIVQQPAAQNGLVDMLVIELIKGFIGGNKPTTTTTTTTGDSSSLQRANETLTRIDGKMDRLQTLIENKLNKVEEDVATLQKSQKESLATIDQRIVETTKLIQNNSDLIKTNTQAILKTQVETGILLSTAGKHVENVELDKGVKIKILTGEDSDIGKEIELPAVTRSEIIRIDSKQVLLRWMKGDKQVIGIMQSEAAPALPEPVPAPAPPVEKEEAAPAEKTTSQRSQSPSVLESRRLQAKLRF